MSPEKQRIAIAESVLDALIAKDGMRLIQRPKGTIGYRYTDLSGLWIYERADKTLYGCNYDTAERCRSGHIEDIAKRKDYLSDLNAIHEVEKAIPSHDWGEYTMQLRRIIMRDCNTEAHYIPDGRSQHIADFWFYHATAAQRAEAYLRTIGKWEDE